MRIGFWYKNSRNVSLPQSILPAIVAFSFGSSSESFVWWMGVLAIIGVALLHLSMNLADDYFDYKYKGTAIRAKMASAGIRARVAKCDYLNSGEASITELGWAVVGFAVVALGIGFVLWWFRGIDILYIASLGCAVGYSYSGKPLKLGYRGLGEAVIGVMFGPLLMIGVYYSATGEFSNALTLLSIAVGLLVTNIVYSHSIMDLEPDRSVGKLTLAGLLRWKWLMLLVQGVILFAPFALVGYGVWSEILTARFCFVGLVLPMAAYHFYLMLQFVRYPNREFKRNPLMGPMEMWDSITSSGIGWFMIRWYLARNLISAFAVIVTILAWL